MASPSCVVVHVKGQRLIVIVWISDRQGLMINFIGFWVRVGSALFPLRAHCIYDDAYYYEEVINRDCYYPSFSLIITPFYSYHYQAASTRLCVSVRVGM